MLQAHEFERLLRQPSLLSQALAYLKEGDLVIIDEVQKLPHILDEVHSLIHRKKLRFILSGSSPRKLKRRGANLLGGRFTSTIKRRAIQSPKFYFFDVGIANYMLNKKNLLPGSEAFGRSFEHFVIQELIAYLGYTQSTENLTYWRTSSGYEVGAIIGDGRIAIEIKSSEEVRTRHLKGLKAFLEDFPKARAIVVSLDKYPRILNGIEIIPAEQFLKALWNSGIF